MRMSSTRHNREEQMLKPNFIRINVIKTDHVKLSKHEKKRRANLIWEGQMGELEKEIGAVNEWIREKEGTIVVPQLCLAFRNDFYWSSF